jgi:tartrate dehydrogenase/decarboxylase/D-malate dehydrogenase
MEVSIFTRAGVARIMRYAFGLTQSRPRKLLTVVTRSNAQRHCMVTRDEIAAEVAKEFPGLTWDKMLVDAMMVRMTLKPQSLDMFVATNLHADVLSDLAGALAGSLGDAPTAKIDPERRSRRCSSPSMAQPSTSQVRVSLIRLPASGSQRRCSSISAGVMPPPD